MALPEVEAWYSPYYCDGVLEQIRRAHLCDFSILGWSRRKECLRYLRRHGLSLDFQGERKGNHYDLIVTSSDVVIPRNLANKPIVGVQEGITDPERVWFWARKLLPFVPRWAAGTAWTGTSNACVAFCAASEGYRQRFIKNGADPERIVVTGIPNFDNCDRYRDNDFPHRNYVLVCTSDSRETLKFDNRKAFVRRALQLAAGRQVIFKLHPNEDWRRSTNEIRAISPEALILTEGCAEEMVANCAVLVCQYSTLAFVGFALKKEVHSYFDLDELQRLLPLQHASGAKNIAGVCRGVLSGERLFNPTAALPTGELPTGDLATEIQRHSLTSSSDSESLYPEVAA